MASTSRTERSDKASDLFQAKFVGGHAYGGVYSGAVGEQTYRPNGEAYYMKRFVRLHPQDIIEDPNAVQRVLTSHPEDFEPIGSKAEAVHAEARRKLQKRRDHPVTQNRLRVLRTAAKEKTFYRNVLAREEN